MMWPTVVNISEKRCDLKKMNPIINKSHVPCHALMMNSMAHTRLDVSHCDCFRVSLFSTTQHAQLPQH